MNIEKSREVYFNVRIEKGKNGKECYDSISIGREDVAKILAKALKAEGFTVSLTRFIHKKSERYTWEEIKI